MKIRTHLDPWVLERELLLAIDRVHPQDGPGHTLVLVPTVRLADHVSRRLGDRRLAWLGLEVLTPSALARRVLADAGAEGWGALPPRVLDALVRQVLEERPDGVWSRYVEQRPGALPRLRAALNDLREAGLAPDAVQRAAGEHERHRELARLYRDYVALLEAGGGTPRLTDEAGVIRAALDGARALGKRVRHVFVHGAYEWIGVHLDLIRALDRGSSLTLFLPGSAGARVAEFADAYRQEFLERAEVKLEPLADPLPIERRFDLAALYDENAVPRLAGADRVAFRHCQGEVAEVEVAVREALAAVRDGCPPGEIAITARSLEPYAAALEQAFEDADLPWTSSLDSPLMRHPLVRDFLLTLEIVAEDFPRRPTAEWLRSPRLSFAALVPEGPPPGVSADLWSRKARLIGGLREWTTDLPRWAADPWVYPGQTTESRERAVRAAEKRAGGARRIGRTLQAVRDRLDPRPRTWGAHAEVFHDTLVELFGEVDDGAAQTAREALGTLLDETALLESVAGDTRRVPFAEAVGSVREAVEQTRVTLYRRDNGGFHVLDAMQLRGLTFKRVFVLGMNAGLFPRPAREDPILGDELRLALRRRTARPLTVKGHGNAEERLLLAGLLGAADDRVEVSWQRADPSGKARAASLALREVARVAWGRASLEAVREHARHLRSHPTQWLEDLVASPGLLAADEELLFEALQATTPDARAALQRRADVLAPGLRLLRATQSFDVVDPAFDGRIGPRPLPERLSVTAFEQLGRCPLQFFFRRVLGVYELDDQAAVLEIAAQDLGSRVHEVLDRLYRTLETEGLMRPDGLSDAIRRAEALLDIEDPQLLGAAGQRLERRVPVLYRQLTSAWSRSLRAFVKADLELWLVGGYRPGAFENDETRAVDLGAGVVQTLHGRFDRTLLRDETVLVGDYKTAGKLGRRVDRKAMLRAETLQVPLYRLLAGEPANVELLGVGPGFETEDTAYREVFSGFTTDEATEGFRETLRTLLELRRGGAFPFKKGMHCGWCQYAGACRRNHPPSQDRELHCDDSRAFRDTAGKTEKDPFLPRPATTS